MIHIYFHKSLILTSFFLLSVSKFLVTFFHLSLAGEAGAAGAGLRGVSSRSLVSGLPGHALTSPRPPPVSDTVSTVARGRNLAAFFAELEAWLIFRSCTGLPTVFLKRLKFRESLPFP